MTVESNQISVTSSKHPLLFVGIIVVYSCTLMLVILLQLHMLMYCDNITFHDIQYNCCSLYILFIAIITDKYSTVFVEIIKYYKMSPKYWISFLWIRHHYLFLFTTQRNGCREQQKSLMRSKLDHNKYKHVNFFSDQFIMTYLVLRNISLAFFGDV